jgi:hypothetical protein
MKSTHYTSIAVEVTTSADYHKVALLDWRGEHNAKNHVIGTFFVPLSSVNKFSMISNDIIRARAKRDFNITFDHNSYSGMITK